MIRRSLFVLLTLLLGVGAVTFADDQAMDAPQMTPEQQAAMAAMQKAATPGPHHEHLNHLVGNWTFAVEMWMEPGAPAMESQGTMEAKWILGGRYVESVVKGELMGEPFEGRGIDGYDNAAGQHFGFWVDNLGTTPMFATGDCSDGGKVTTMTGDFVDPASGETVRQRVVTTIVDDDHYVIEMYHTMGGGNEQKVMKLTATRR